MSETDVREVVIVLLAFGACCAFGVIGYLIGRGRDAAEIDQWKLCAGLEREQRYSLERTASAATAAAAREVAKLRAERRELLVRCGETTTTE